jgi:alpha,alpha-trehalase
MTENKHSGQEKTEVDLSRFKAAILDMDGVVTSSRQAHAAAWKRMFDEYLRKHAREHGGEFKPFDDGVDYNRYVDGKPRYDGARSFLESRGISLPYGSPDDQPGKETVCGLGNLKNRYFQEYLEKNGMEPFHSTVDFVHKMQDRKMSVAVISSSRNAKKVLEAAGVRDLFQAIVDGEYMSERNLEGKPEPDIFLEAAKNLNVSPDRAIVIEDAISGVKAGKAGGFGLVIGIDRSGNNPELKDHGADIVVSDLSELKVKEK